MAKFFKDNKQLQKAAQNRLNKSYNQSTNQQPQRTNKRPARKGAVMSGRQNNLENFLASGGKQGTPPWLT